MTRSLLPTTRGLSPGSVVVFAIGSPRSGAGRRMLFSTAATSSRAFSSSLAAEAASGVSKRRRYAFSSSRRPTSLAPSFFASSSGVILAPGLRRTMSSLGIGPGSSVYSSSDGATASVAASADDR